MAAQSSRGTVYEGIADDIRRRIRAGEFALGDSVGTLPDLQAHYGAAQNTIREALKVLAAEGLVVTLAGKGTFVSSETPGLAVKPVTAVYVASLEKRIDELEVQVMEIRAVTGLEQWQPDARAEAQL